MSKPAWARALVFLAGPFMNLVLAVLVLCSMGLLTGLPTGRSNQVLEVHPGTEAARVGLRTGDRIVGLNGQHLESGEALIDAIEAHAGDRVLLSVERDGQTIQLPATPMAELQLIPQVQVEDVEPGSAAAKIGLRTGDQVGAVNGRPIQSGLEIGEAMEGARQPFTLTVRRGGSQELTLPVPPGMRDLPLRWDVTPLARSLGLSLGDRIDAVNGRKVKTRSDLLEALRASAGQPVTLQAERGSDLKKLPPQRVSDRLADPEQVRTVGKMGFLPAPKFRKMSFRESVSAGWEAFLAFFVSLYGMVASGQIGKNAGSVVTMYRATVVSSKLGMGSLLNLTASLSLSLAVFNLLPIPVLDGGHLALLSVEVVRRRRLRPAEYRVATVIGFAVVVVAFVLLMYLDVMKWRAGTPLINL